MKTLSLFFLIFDPYGSFNLKIPFCIILIFYIFNTSALNIPKRKIIVFITVLVFLIIFVFKQLFYGYFGYMNILVYTFLFFAIFYLNKSVDMIYALINAISLILFLNLIMGLVNFFDFNLAVSINQQIKNYKIFSFEYREHYLFNKHSIYHNSIYICIIAVPYFLNNIFYYKISYLKKLFFITCIFSLLMTQSRSILLGTFIIFLFYLPYYLSFLLLILISSLFIGFNFEVFSYFIDSSTSTKFIYYKQYLNVFQNIFDVLFGTGPLPFYWEDVGPRSFIELTYLEIFRYFGIIGAVLILFFFTIVIKNMGTFRENKTQFIGLIAYLFIISFNPYVWGLTGFPILGLFLSQKLKLDD